MKILLFCICSLITSICIAQADLLKTIPNHPRILLLRGEEKRIIRNTETDKNWAKIHNVILAESQKMLDLPELERIQIGRRLLDKSREAIRNIFLSYAYRTTNNKKFLDRAEKELLKVCQFSDWNPSHFLDVAEMTLSVAIGYDWLYDDLSPTNRKIIADAILSKGIEPSLDSKYNSWLTATHNWNQVCNAGVAYGALAVFESHPEISKRVIERAISSIKLPMEDFQPDGAYPEGYSYWGYGTSFNVLFINALQKVVGSDFGLIASPGFLKTAAYFQHMIGTSGKNFNYSDAGNDQEINPAMFWFAEETKNMSLLFSQKSYLENNEQMARNRLLPAAMIWGAKLNLDSISIPKELFWSGQGKNPVAMMRTSWTNPNAIFVGFKTGSPSVNHGHMDVGSFVMDAVGERWAMDFGMQNYNSLESKGVNLWDKTQNSQRWEVYRYNNLAHNTLTFDGKYQIVDGKAKIDKISKKTDFMSAQSDITEVYKNQISSAKRGVGIVNKSYVIIRDEIETSDTERTVRWSMVTPANTNLLNSRNAELTQNNKKLKLQVLEPKNVELNIWSTIPTHDYDASNSGTSIVGFEIVIPKNTKQNIVVTLVPQKAKIRKVKSLDNW